MDPLTLILSALTAGITASVKDTASTAVKDAYNGFKTLIQRRFSDQPKAQTALVDYEEDSETYEQPLRKALSIHHLDQDEEIIAAAQKVMQLAQSEQGAMKNYAINFHGPVQGPTIGDLNTITQTFGDITQEK
jgi:hypothetical protein